jgi:hypothetical protein
MERYPMPDFAWREVTNDVRYTGSELATCGLPTSTATRA